MQRRQGLQRLGRLGHKLVAEFIGTFFLVFTVGMVVIDGKVASGRSRNTPPADTIPEVVLEG